MTVSEMFLLGETKRLLREYDIRPKRSLGQNFCVDKKLLERMVAYANLCRDDTVLEVGSGFGFLTRCLLEVAKRLIAVELDPKLLNALRDCLGSNERVTIVSGNILKMKLPNFNKVVANPPYSISSQLIKLLFNIGFERAVLTLQKEFGEKLIAQAGTRNYGPLAVIAKYMASVSVLENLPRESFYPQPKVESVIVLIEACETKFNVVNKGLFFEVVGYLFTQRNRKVKSPLESFLLRKMGISKAEAKLIIESLPFIKVRVCDMRPEDFGTLSNKIHIFLEGKRIGFKNHSFYVFPEVYEPAEDTFLAAEHLDVQKGDNVLDMGTGCGLLGVLAAEKAESVIVVDINPHALECAIFNAKLNNAADKVDTLLSDLFGGFKAETRFDFIIFNPPYLPVDEKIRPEKWLERAWYGGRNGMEIIDRFLKSVQEHVAKNGRVLMVQSSLSNPEESVKTFREKGFETKVIAKEDFFFEKIMVIRAKKLARSEEDVEN